MSAVTESMVVMRQRRMPTAGSISSSLLMPVRRWRSLEPVEADPAAPSNGRPLHQEAHLSAEAKGLSRTRLLTRHISTSRK